MSETLTLAELLRHCADLIDSIEQTESKHGSAALLPVLRYLATAMGAATKTCDEMLRVAEQTGGR